jgi:lactate dehydrogenase-like 2-hydroxyacid dehydrogenase
MLTSHMAFLTREALENIADTTLQTIGEYEQGRRGRALTHAVTGPA